MKRFRAMGDRAVFLDRDGVLNEAVIRDGKPTPPLSQADVLIFPGTRENLSRLKEKGFCLLVVTNQPDVARGQQKREIVEEINQYLRSSLPLDQIYTCYHDDRDGCACRKPLPGLLIEGASDWGIDPQRSFLIGDRWRDIEAGRQAGCTTILIDGQYDERQAVNPDYTVSSLVEAVEIILSKSGD